MAPITRNKPSNGLFKIPLGSFEGRSILRSYDLKRAMAPLTMSLVLLILAGCATTYTAYEGATLPSEQMAILEGFEFKFSGDILAEGIDQLNITNFDQHSNIELLPGWHTVRLQHEGIANSWRRGSVQFYAEAGHVYEIQADDQREDVLAWVRFWITDKNTGQIIADVTQPSVEVIRAYDGPELSRNETAVIKGTINSLRDFCFITCHRETLIGVIDEKWEIPGHWPDFVEVEVLPGQRDVSLVYLYHENRRDGYKANLEFTAEPGHSYEANSQLPSRSDEPVRFWIEDANTKQVVAEIYCSRETGGDEQLAACTR